MIELSDDLGWNRMSAWQHCSSAFLLVAISWSTTVLPAKAADNGLASTRVASESEIVEAMTTQKSLGYNVLATANGARFSAAVILYVLRRQSNAGTAETPILIDHHDYFQAFLDVTGLKPEQAPTFVRMPDQFGADRYIDPRRDQVIDKILVGAAPKLAANVVIGWADGPGVAQEFSYTDQSSTPPLKVTNKRITSYRILDFGDTILYDNIQGIYGRATGGILGLMFNVIGDGRAVRSFMGYSPDGIQVTRTTAEKGFVSVTETATVSSEGRGEKGVPPNRPDLARIEQRLKEPFSAKYFPIRVDPSDWSDTMKRRH